MLIEVIYNHPLHGEQKLICSKLVMINNEMRVMNIHLVTFQVIDPERIKCVRAHQLEKPTVSP